MTSSRWPGVRSKSKSLFFAFWDPRATLSRRRMKKLKIRHPEVNISHNISLSLTHTYSYYSLSLSLHLSVFLFLLLTLSWSNSLLQRCIVFGLSRLDSPINSNTSQQLGTQSLCLAMSIQITLTVGGSITAWVFSSFTSLDSTASLQTNNNIFFRWWNPILLNWRPGAHNDFPTILCFIP